MTAALCYQRGRTKNRPARFKKNRIWIFFSSVVFDHEKELDKVLGHFLILFFPFFRFLMFFLGSHVKADGQNHHKVSPRSHNSRRNTIEGITQFLNLLPKVISVSVFCFDTGSTKKTIRNRKSREQS